MKKYFRAIGHCMAFIAAFWLTGCTYPLNLAGKINVPQITIAQDSKPDIEFIGIRRDSSNVGSTGGTEVVKYNGHYESWSEGFGTFGDGFNIKFSGNNSPVNEIGQKLQQMGVIFGILFYFTSIRSHFESRKLR